MKFWICLTLGLLTYFLLGRAAVNEVLNFVLTIAVMAAAWAGYGWVIEGQLPFAGKKPPKDEDSGD